MTDLLVVCTFNIARSPLFERMLQAAADDRLEDGAVAIASAGTQGAVGHPAADAARKLAADRGLSLDDHLSRPLFYLPVDEVPLIITMTRAHRQQLLDTGEDRERRTFLLRELLTLSQRLRDDRELASLPSADDDPQARLRVVAAVADAKRPLKLKRRHADVPDPLDGRSSSFRRLGREFDEATSELTDVLFGPRRSPATRG